jgi:hypothetical protein
MINFDTALDQKGTARRVEIPEVMPQVTETVTIRRPIAAQRETRVTFAGKDPAQWNWEDLRSYVIAQIEQRFGAFPRDPKKEHAIFMSFAGRWGAQAGPIARFAFEQCNGYWKGAPISVTRFCKASDSYFAEQIASRIK